MTNKEIRNLEDWARIAGGITRLVVQAFAIFAVAHFAIKFW